MKPGIAFFDFDGTITTRDTLIEFIRFYKGSFSLYTGFLLNSYYLLAYKLKIISNQKAKEKILHHFFGGMTVNEFEQVCKDFTAKKLPGLIRSRAVSEIKDLQQKSIETVIVSASPENWVIYFATAMNMKLLATELELSDNKITGRISGSNCHGKEKVKRIHSTFQLNNYKEIYAYGDSSGDKPMLSLAHHSFMKPFR